MRDLSLANVLLIPDDFAAGHVELYYRADRAEYDNNLRALAFVGEIDFSTYFNAFSLRKWCRYTNVGPIFLHLEFAGDECSVLFVELTEGVSAAHINGTPIMLGGSHEGFASVDLRLPESDAPLVSFVLHSKGTTRVKAAYYYTEVDDALVRPVRLALCTTTFKKEDYIVPNIETVRREVLAGNEPISDGFHMYVVDNGRTLDVETLSDDGVTIVPNPNVGGAGGFARGMLEALAGGATHVLLMDDDVHVSPESFKRTYNLLSLVKNCYKQAFLNGAMLSLEEPNLQYEDVGFVRKDGIYDKVKPDLHVDQMVDVVKNEVINVEVENAYGAWWYCCIPVEMIREYGLPLPVFVRCDDVEYGMRCRPTIMTMGGICVWHASFEGRFRASVDCYQYVRNFLIMLAADEMNLERMFMLRLKRTFDIYLRSLNYGSAELLLDGLEDYLKGPSFLASANGEELMKLNGAKNERLVPLSELDSAVISKTKPDDNYLAGEDMRGPVLKLLEMLPHDRHFLPDMLLSDEPAAVYYSRGAYPGWKTMRRRTLVAFDASGKNAHVRTLDRARYQSLRKRYRRLMQEYASRKDEVAHAYRDAMPWLTSEAFWRTYLVLGESA